MLSVRVKSQLRQLGMTSSTDTAARIDHNITLAAAEKLRRLTNLYP